MDMFAPYEADPSRIPDTRIIQTHDREVRVLLRVEKPSIVVMDNVMSEGECELLIEASREHLQPSRIYTGKGNSTIVSKRRTSLSASLGRGDSPFTLALNQRLCEIMSAPLDHAEGLHIGYYKPGASISPHTDYFTLHTLPAMSHIAAGGQRVATLIVYLNDVPSGGETHFPKVGLRVKPKRGMAVYFEYCNSQGVVDPDSIHESTPTVDCEKWIATKWLRERCFPN